MIFELWDVGTDNLVGSYASEHEALEAVRKAVDHHGPAIVAPWVLTSTDLEHSRTVTVARGAKLRQRATSAMPA